MWNDNGTFMDLVFTNVPVDVSVACADFSLLKLDRHHRAYEIEMWACGVANLKLWKVKFSVICS
jgi:hypothetical protein